MSKNDKKPEIASAFVPIKDESGKTRGMMDRTTADYFTSSAPNPRQADLDAIFTRVTRVKIIKMGWRTATESIPPQTLIDTDDLKAIAELRGCLVVRDSRGHVMTFGSEFLELWSGEEIIAKINLIYLCILRWIRWKNDAVLIDPLPFENWLARNGAPELKDRAEKRRIDAEHGAEKTIREEEHWVSNMPECVRSFWPNMKASSGSSVALDLIPIRQALLASFPDVYERARALFAWYGSSLRSVWSGYPIYEDVPQKVLWDMPTQTLIRALDGYSLSEAELEGAARFFGAWDFRKHRKAELRLISAELKARLWDHSLKSQHVGNIERARRAF